MNQVHAMQDIANTGSLPMSKTPLKTVGTDAMMQATALTAELMAYVRGQAPKWHGFAVRIINLTTDGRAAFIKQLKEQTAEMRKANADALAVLDKAGKPDPSKSDNKTASGRVRSALVEVSKLSTIANAFNSGATIEGLIEHHATTGRQQSEGLTLEHVGYEVMVEYARLFSKSGAGRKADPWLVKFGKWLESQGKVGDDADEITQAQYAQAVALFNAMSK